MTKNRLSKILAAAGVASRRKCEELIFEGRVAVNRKKVLVPQTMVDPKKDHIAVDGEKITKSEKKVYYIFNKPKGYVCSNDESFGKKRVLSFFEQEAYRLFTVGRLDRDTEGLLIVTNDGHFANDIIHPSSNIEKEYLVKANKEITDQHLIRMSKGGFVEGTFVKPVSVKKMRKNAMKITVKEGKKREVRKLVEKAELEVLELTRIRIGNLRLGNLPVSFFKKMTEADKAALFE